MIHQVAFFEAGQLRILAVCLGTTLHLPHPNTLCWVVLYPVLPLSWQQRFYFCLNFPTPATVFSYSSSLSPGHGYNGRALGTGHIWSRSLSNICRWNSSLIPWAWVCLWEREFIDPNVLYQRTTVTSSQSIPWYVGRGHETRWQWTGLLNLGATLCHLYGLEQVISHFGVSFLICSVGLMLAAL